MYKVYLIVNEVNFKVYVGKTKQVVRTRWAAHKREAAKGRDIRFYRAIRKYGPDGFTVRTLVETLSSEHANLLERLWVLALQATDPGCGYNSTFGGDGGCLTEESRLKIAPAIRRAFKDPIVRAKLKRPRPGLVGAGNPMFGRHEDHPFFGRKHTTETKRALSDRRKQLFQDPEFKARMAAANTGKHHTAEGRANISAALQGNQYRRGIPHSAETKARISASTRAAKRAVYEQSLVEASVPAPSALDVGPASL